MAPAALSPPRRARSKASSSLAATLVAALAALTAVALLPTAARAQFGMPGGMAPEKPPPAVTTDIPYVRCQVCKLVVKEAARLADDLRNEAAAKPGKKLEEADIIEKLERICSPADDAGEWATRVDFVESGTALKVVDTGSSSRCNSECSTAARACERAFGDSADLSDVSEALYARKPSAEVAVEVCGEPGDGEGKACSERAPPPLPKDRPAGPKHEPMSERDASVAKMMRQLKASGMGGQMFDRESLMKNKKMMKGLAGGGGGGDDEDEDDEDEEEWETEGGAGGSKGGVGAPGGASAVGAAAAQKVDELASKAKETLGGALGWIKGKVGAGGSAGSGEL